MTSEIETDVAELKLTKAGGENTMARSAYHQMLGAERRVEATM